MGHGKRKILGDVTFQQHTGVKGEKYIQKHLICQNDACCGIPISEPLDNHYLTHPEGRINEKREEPHVLINMEGDSNATKQKESFKCILLNYCHSLYGKENALNNKKSTMHSSANIKKKKNPKYSCIGKIIHIDTVVQTDTDFQKKNKSTDFFKNKNIYTQHKAKRESDEINEKIEICKNIPPKKSSEWQKKRKRNDDKIDIYRKNLDTEVESKNVLPKTSSKWLGKRRRRSRIICICPRKVKQQHEVDTSDNNKCQKHTIVLECEREQKNPKKNETRNRSPLKEYKGEDVCAKGICVEAFNEKNTNFFGKYKENPVVYTAKTHVIPTNNEARSKSLMDVKKIKSLITCLCSNSKKIMSKKRSTRRKPIYIKLDVCKKGIKVAIIDKTENSCEQVCRKKFFLNNINKKSPQKTKIHERINTIPEKKVSATDKHMYKPAVTNQKYKEKVHSKRKNKKLLKKTDKEITKNAGDQTEEAIIKIDVDPFGRCVVNLNEIENKRTDLNRNNKEKPICICPSKIKRNKRKNIDIYKCFKISPKKAGDQRRNQLTKTELVIEKSLYPNKIKNKEADPKPTQRVKQTCMGFCKLKKKKPKQVNTREIIDTIPKSSGDQRRDQLIQIDVDVLKKCLNLDKVKNLQTDSKQKYKEKRTCCGPCKAKSKKPQNIIICECNNTISEKEVGATDKHMFNQKHKEKVHSKRINKKLPKKTDKEIPKNAGDQTEEAIIKIGVDPFGRCVVNLNEIEHKQADLNENNKDKPICICPSKIKTNKPKNIDIYKCFKISPKNAGDQRRDPLFEIKLDATDKRVLNPDIIRNKQTAITPNYKKETTCVCPSHNTRFEQYLSENVCKGKICQKMIRDKKINFNCKCPHIKEKDLKEVEEECTDRTCGSNVIKKRHNKCSKKCIRSARMTGPQFEVQLDAKTLCVLNPEEIGQKIIDIDAEVCPGGTCAAARCENRNLFKCKCVQKKPEEITECSRATCVDDDTEHPVDLLNYWPTKVFNKVGSKTSKYRMKRNINNKPFDRKELKKIKSMFAFICDRLKRTSEIWNGSEATKKTSCPLSSFQPQKTNYHRRSGLNLPFGKSRRAQPAFVSVKSKSSKSSEPSKSSKSSVLSICGCAKEMKKRKAQKGKDEDEQYATENKQRKKERLKKQKIEEKKRKKRLKEEQKEMQALSKQDEAGDTSCLADFIRGIFNMGFGIVHCVFWLVFKTITEPKVTYRKARRHIRNPKRTFEQVKKWISDKWRRQKFYMSRSIKGSRTMTIITDELKETPCVQAFASKGETQAERKIIEAQKRRRQQRIRKRRMQAVHGCRDILLVTMRKTPCLWVYHVCPDFYPRCLSLRMNFIKICQLFLFCLAVVVWTPCILCCELCRGFICCVTCSQ